ncbi:glycosyltransferase [Kordiimonas lacus]|uniref:Glycosyltransferase involved in cell wall bisynthesis n=1 Tax=Kordiimonas lacus TaxID=637679 RepID=A0A1G7FFL0_9PROT|nr:glycosyltransferase [Kordiimonas lacus]SDE74679.1 Glycosyltransferase involved in cell wall bisynthesis [Kordiimonas lacus]
MTADKPPMRVLVFGTADMTKPRVRLLLEGLRLEGHEVIDCTRNIWDGVSDKSQVRGNLAKVGLALNWLWSMLVLSLRYLFAPKHDAVLVCYPGHLDLWFIRPLSYLRRAPVVWDAFLSAYDTIVLDRRMAKPKSLIGRLAYAMDWCACRLCDRLFLDTPAHARFFEKTFRLPANTVEAVPVGAERQFSPPQETAIQQDEFKVLFYGQFIPLHGLPTILDAVYLLQGEDIKFTIIGQGQMSEWFQDALSRRPIPNLAYIKWVEYEELPKIITEHSLCLGIFSASDKANRVVANKVYQILNTGAPLLTRDSDAMRAILNSNSDQVSLIPPENPELLADAVLQKYKNWLAAAKTVTFSDQGYWVTARDVGQACSELFERTLGKKNS